MKTFPTAIAALLLGAALTLPLAAQLDITVEGVSDPSILGETVVFDSEFIGQRVSKRLYLKFDPGSSSSLGLRNVRVKGSQDFTYEIDNVTRLPVVIRNELELDLFVFYLPSGPGPARSTLELTLRFDQGDDTEPTDTVYSINLVGRVPAYSLSYVAPGAARRTVPAEGVVDFGNKPTNVASEATLILTNSGSGPGTVQSVTVSGTSAFSLADPPTFPARLEPGRSLNMQLAFSPSSMSVYRGELTIDYGKDRQRYVLVGIGGDRLRYSLISYPPGANVGVPTDVQSGTEVVFGQSAAVVEVVGRNDGQSAQLIENISLRGPFAMTQVPRLPKSVAPGESITVRLEPRASATGDYTGELVIGDAVFPLSLDVPALPPVQFSTAGRVLTVGEQVPIGLGLASPYPVDIAGTLQLELASTSFQNDQALQWSSGGRQVDFSIPAGTTAAVFAGNASMIEFQSASVAGEITVSARFLADAWGIDITPIAVPEVRFTVEIKDLPEFRFTNAGGPVGGGDEIELGLILSGPYPEAITGTPRPRGPASGQRTAAR